MTRKSPDQVEAERQELLAEIRSLKAALRNEQQLVKENRYLRDIMAQVLERLPTVTTDRTIGESTSDD